MNTAQSPTLVIIRGNSGSGKSSVARELRRRYGRGVALIGQDEVRRGMLREHGSTSTPTIAPGFLMTMVRAALAGGYHVVLEGILHSGQHGDLLRDLIADHPGPVYVCWMDISFDETVRRHRQRPEPFDVSAQQMRSWYTPMDLLGVPGEQIIEEASRLEETVTRILRDSGLAAAAALTPCPMVCPRCAQKHDTSTASDSGPVSEHGTGIEAAGRRDTVARLRPHAEQPVVAGSPHGIAGGGDGAIWETVALSRAWLDEHNGTADTELGLRILKIVEEAGEAAAAWIGTVGQNPRKGVTHNREDVAGELGDVAFTALVAIASLGHRPQDVLAQVADKVRTRLATADPAPSGGTAADSQGSR